MSLFYARPSLSKLFLRKASPSIVFDQRQRPILDSGAAIAIHYEFLAAGY